MNAVAARKARGAFFTPPEMASFIANWALRAPTDVVLEPSCGEAAFLLPTVRRLTEIGAVPSALSQQVFGAELYAPSAAEACAAILADSGLDLASNVRIGDFFECRAGVNLPFADACIGNPPYVRYQAFAGDARRRGREAALAQGVTIDGLASSWAPFTVHAASFLRPGGRLGLVLPAELLSVNYAAPVRKYLLGRFASVRVVLFQERVFPGVLEEVVLLLAEGEGPCNRFDLVQLNGLSDLESLETRVWLPSPDSGKWTDLLLPDGVKDAIRAVEATGAMATLGECANVGIGMVTGANEYFCITDQMRHALDLTAPHLKKILPPGSKHTPGIAYTAESWERAAEEGKRVWLFSPASRKSKAAVDYIAAGVAQGRDAAYKCRVRSPWYSVPLVKAPDAFMVYMANEGPRMISNPGALIHVNSVHGVHLHSSFKPYIDAFTLASLSTFTLLSAELAGRAYGGGLLKLEPREASRMAVPSLDTLRKSSADLERIRGSVEAHLARREFEAAVTLVDGVILEGALGLDEDIVASLRLGRMHLFGRRRSRS